MTIQRRRKAQKPLHRTALSTHPLQSLHRRTPSKSEPSSWVIFISLLDSGTFLRRPAPSATPGSSLSVVAKTPSRCPCGRDTCLLLEEDEEGGGDVPLPPAEDLVLSFAFPWRPPNPLSRSAPRDRTRAGRAFNLGKKWGNIRKSSPRHAPSPAHMHKTQQHNHSYPPARLDKSCRTGHNKTTKSGSNITSMKHTALWKPARVPTCVCVCMHS